MNYLKLPIALVLALVAWTAMLAVMALAVLVGTPLMRLGDFIKAKSASKTPNVQRLPAMSSGRQESTQF